MGLGALVLASSALAEPRTHDGFYMHLDAGLGYYSAKASVGGVDDSFSGVTFASSLFFGGSPTPGLAIAGGFFTDYSASPTRKTNGVESPVKYKQFLLGIGPLVDFYINPNEGLHFQGFVGWGGLETSVEGDVGGDDPTGLVTFIGGGYDWWVGDEWSIGVMGRLAYAPLKLNDTTYTTISPSILATFTYH